VNRASRVSLRVLALALASMLATMLATLLASIVAPGVANAGPDNRPPPAPDSAGAQRRPGPADNRRIVGILEVRVDGVPDEVKERFQRGLEDQLDTKHYWLASRAHVKQMMMRSTRWTEGCVVGPCLAEVRAQTGAELVLLAALTGSGTSFGYVVTLVRTDTGRVLQQESDRCDVCTVNEAMTQATLATTGLLNNVPDKLPDEAADQSATLDLAVGKVKRELAERDRHSRRVGTVLTAVGVAVAIGGLALYLVDDQPTYGAVTAGMGGALAAGGIVVLTF
jgi:hypothetical protein